MKSKAIAIYVLTLGLVHLAHASDRTTAGEEETVKLKPYVVEEKSLANTGFAFKAKFRHHMIWAGIKELVITQVESRSVAKKAGLEVGEKILQIRDVKVDGLSIKELKKEFEEKSVNGKIMLVIQAKDSKESRTVELQFNDSAAPLPQKETEPGKSPEPTPTPTASRPPAAQEPRQP